jgi:hypothetical protein
MSPAAAFLALIGQHPKPPPIPSHIVPKLVELGLGHPVIKEAWNLCFWTGWWGGFLAGFLLASVLCLAIVAFVLAIVCLVLWVSDRRRDHHAAIAASVGVPLALPGHGVWADPRPPWGSRPP